MKNKILSVLLVFILSLLALFSCKIGGDSGSGNGGAGGGDNGSGDSGNNGDSGNDAMQGAIFSSSNVPYVIRGVANTGKEFVSCINALRTAVENKIGKSTNIDDDLSAVRAHEIVLGESDREITAKAQSRLRRMLLSAIKDAQDEDFATEDLEGYTVYSSGDSVAIVWSDDRFMEDAVNYFIENFVIDSSLVLREGYSSTVIVSTEEYLENKEKEIYDAAWARLGAAIDEEYSDSIVEALQLLYTLYTDDMYVWLANLYDPAIGGFYATNSGRDTVGFLPDIESTSSALSFITTTKMYTDGSYGDVLPQQLKDEIGAFVTSLQAEDGYFYHPQWGENVNTSRKGRDLSSAITLLRNLGKTSVYPYPGTSSSGSSAHLATPLKRQSAVSLVSSVVTVNSSVPEQFRSLENYQAYLNAAAEKIEAGESDFYSFGNELQSQVKQIQSYGASLGVDLMKVTTDFLTLHQNQENGLWSNKFNYNATNGFHKISDVYNLAKVEIPNAEKAVESAIRVITDESLKITAPVEIYNAWSCISYVIENIRECSSGTNAEKEARVEKILESSYAIAADAIVSSFNMIIPARRDDGSFSYSISGYSSGSHQGSPVGVPNSFEGDVNGNALATTSLTLNIYGALDLSEYVVPIFTEIDLERYLDTITSLGAVEKDPVKTESTLYDFEDALDAGNVPTELAPSDGTGGGSLSIGTDEEGNKYLKFEGKDLTGTTLSNPSFEITAEKLSASPNKVFFDMDVTFEDGKGLSLMLYGNKGIIMQVAVSVRDGMISVKNNADTENVLLQARANDTLKLHFEYVWFDDGTGYLAVYKAGDELPSGITTAAFAGKGVHQELTYIHIGADRAYGGTTRIDNLRLEGRYVHERELEMPSIKPTDRIVYDFENMDEYLIPITVSNGKREEGTDNLAGTATVVGDEDKYVEYIGVPAIDSGDRDGDGTSGENPDDREPGFSQPSIKAYANSITPSPNKSLIEMDLNFISSTDSNFNAVMYVYSTKGFLTQFNFKVSGGAVTMAAEGDSSNTLIKVAQGKEFKLKIEYVPDSENGYFAVYVNGSDAPSGVSTVLPSSSKGHAPLNYITFGSSRSNSGTIHLDNIIVENDYDAALESEITQPTLPPPESVVYGFEDMEVGETVLFPLKYTVGEGELSVAEDETGNHYLKYVGKNDDPELGNPSITLDPNAIDPNYNMAVFEITLTFESVTYATVYIEGLTGGAMTQISFYVRGSNVEVVNSAMGSDAIYVTPKTEAVKLRVEFYWTEGYYKLSFDDGKTVVYTDKLDANKTYKQLRDVVISTSKSTVGVLRIDNLMLDAYYLEEIPKPEYTLTFDVDGEEYRSLTVSMGSQITLPEAPEKDGFAFEGWFLDNGVWEKELTDGAVMPAANTTVYAKFAEIIPEYTITFTVEGEEYHTLTTKANAEITLPEAPKKEGYVFVGWYFDEGVWSERLTSTALTAAPLTENTEVYAKFVEKQAGGTVSQDGDSPSIDNVVDAWLTP